MNVILALIFAVKLAMPTLEEQAARRLLEAAAADSNAWNHDDLVHAANTTLGRLALKRGDVSQAKARLLDSARVNGSAALESFGPSMELAQELLAVGERDAVLQYFDQCRGFWKYDRGRIDNLIAAVQAGSVAKAPAFRLKDLAGKEWTLDQLSGRVVVIAFWTTWCPRCREEMPTLEKLPAGGVVVLAVNVGEDDAMVRHFVEENRVSLPVLAAGDDTIVLNYRVQTYPTVVVIGRKGQVAVHQSGALSEPELKLALENAGVE